MTLAQRDVQESRLISTSEKLEDLQRKYDIEKTRNEILERDLVERQEDSEAAARTYEAAIRELKSRLDNLQTERDELKKEND